MNYDQYHRMQKLKNADDPLRLIYMWVKQGVITLVQFREMLDLVKGESK